MIDITGQFELSDWWNKSIEERDSDWKATYTRKELGYDEYIGKFTYDTRKFTGEFLLKEIKKDGSGAFVLDVGCGNNPFKNRLKNVIGVEPGTWGSPDINTDLQGAYDIFKENTFDWILAIGVLHHHNTETIHTMIEQMKHLVKSNGKIACLCKPFNGYKAGAELYPWSFETTHAFSKAHNLEYYLDPVIDYTYASKVEENERFYLRDPVKNGKTRERIFWIWQKK